MNDELQLLEMELADLPKGTIVWKKTSKSSDVKKPYLQWREGSKTRSKYISPEELDSTTENVRRRKELQERIRQLKKEVSAPDAESMQFNLNVVYGDNLKSLIRSTVQPERRNCFQSVEKYLYSPFSPRICSIYGLRRTGKTTLLHQLIDNMSPDNFKKAVYIKARKGQTMAMLDNDLKRLHESGFVYIFIDEITFLEDFIDTASILSDIYAGMGMKIVISGTDSLGIWLSSHEELYDRTYMIHTTWIPYSEHSRLLGTEDVDSYIEFGGTLRAGETDFDDPELMSEDVSFRDDESTRRYIDTAICRNIQHSLKCYENGTRFMHLQELYDANELTNAINRIIESMNHRFVLRVLTEEFQSNDLKLARKNLLRERDLTLRTDILQHIDTETVTKGLMRLLNIIDEEDAKIPLTNAHVQEIRDYLTALDLIEPCPVEYYDPSMDAGENILIMQPGMRFCQAQALVHMLLKDDTFNTLDISQKNYVCSRILDEIRGRMLEEIVLIETKKLLGNDYQVFKYQFIGGEYDMVIYNRSEQTCRIYEIKHSKEMVKEQCRHLLNEESCQLLESRFGRITEKYVLYRGESCLSEWRINYLNVSSFLKMLPAGSIE